LLGNGKNVPAATKNFDNCFSLERKQAISSSQKLLLFLSCRTCRMKRVAASKARVGACDLLQDSARYRSNGEQFKIVLRLYIDF
jgi:hypothetical protein